MAVFDNARTPSARWRPSWLKKLPRSQRTASALSIRRPFKTTVVGGDHVGKVH